MPPEKIVIVGAGQAGDQIAASLRQEGFRGRILLIGDEAVAPYHRPPLSKAYLKYGDSARLAMRGTDFYQTNDICLRLATRVTAIDRQGQLVEFADGSSERYDHLVIATGARNRALSIEGAALDGVVELRSLSDAEQLRARIAEARRVVVIGGGFIGLESAASIRSFGIQVTVVEALPRLMTRTVCEEMSSFFLDAHRRMGSDVRLDAKVARIVSDGDGKVSAVELGDGGVVPCDLVLVAVGVIPNAELGYPCGLGANDGIAVNENLLTSDPAISAIGDCAFFPDARGVFRRLESVQNAIDHAKCVARRLTGKPRPYDAVPWFWSDQGEFKLQIAGTTMKADEYVIRGNVEAGKFSVFALRDGMFVGAETVNNPMDHMATRRILGLPREVSSKELGEAGHNLRAFL